jgi:rare lipoprotein A (peptidoglycan hydrolase)
MVSSIDHTRLQCLPSAPRQRGSGTIVKINDRGPYTPGLIIDLFPRAADVLDMKRAEVVTVAIEP